MSTQTQAPESLEDFLKPLTTSDPNAEPLIAKQTQEKIIGKRNGGNTRFYNPNHRSANAAANAPMFLTTIDRDLNFATDAEHRLKPTLSVRLPETVLNSVCGKYWLLYIDLFVYHGDARTRIPSEIVDETEEQVDGETYVKFDLELEQWALDALNLRLPLNDREPLAGFSGQDGEGRIAIVIVAS